MNNSTDKRKVLFVGAARSTHGGVTSVLKVYETMNIWHDFNCRWFETQTNSTKLMKLLYAVTSALKAPFVVHKFDIIHFHTIPGMSMLVQLPVFLCALVYGKKIIIHLHCGDQLEDYRESRFSKWVMNSATLVIVLSNQWKTYLEQNYRLRSRVTCLYNPLPAIVPEEGERKKFILFAAYFAPNKGYETVLKAFSLISMDFPDWKLVMAGTGQKKDMDTIREYVVKNNLSSRVEIPGWLGGDRKKEVFSAASVYCLASRTEGFPMSVTESWAYGTPVVSTRVGSLVDVAQDGKNILFFEYGNHNMLAEKLRILLDSQALWKSISTESVKLSGLFSSGRIEMQLRDIYNTL